MELKPAHSLTLEELAALFNLAFTDYVGGNIHFTGSTLARFLARDNVDLDLSQIILSDGQPVGFGFIERQGWSSRLAAFGIVPAASGMGLGKEAMTRLIAQARQRGDHQFELEVIEQNTRGVRLYEGVGFQRVRRLVGYDGKPLPPPVNPPLPEGEGSGVRANLQPIDILAVARLIVQHGAADLPWSLAGTTIARHSPPDLAYRLDQAYIVISNPEAQTIAIRALIVPPEQRRQGQATRLLNALFTRYPDKHWVISAVCPEEIGAELFAHFGFERQPISQFQMRLKL